MIDLAPSRVPLRNPSQHFFRKRLKRCPKATKLTGSPNVIANR